MTYINTSLFILPLITIILSRTWGLWRSNKLVNIGSFRSLLRHLDSANPKTEEENVLRGGSFDDEGRGHDDVYVQPRTDADEKLGLKATAKLSFQFCLLWVWALRSEDM